MNEQNDVSREAGRELDALIAERVMGYEVSRIRAGALLVEVYAIERRDEAHPSFDVVMCNYYPVSVRRYSTDIAAAWEVVEKLNETERWPTIQFGPSEDGDLRWWVTLVNPADADVYAETAPLAICRAALKAVASVPSGVTEV